MVELVGILNVTPDSFSDGGMHFKPEQALAAALRLISEGASIIDIGAESTRPGATPLTHAEEWSRLEPVLAKLPSGARFSVDTRHGETARKALECGAHWINDVSGFSAGAMVKAVKASDCQLVVMHSLGVPADKSVVMPASSDIVRELIEWGKKRIAALQKSGIPPGRIVFDPGIGFGKTAAQSLAIVLGIRRFKELSVPLLVGHSRKSFLSLFSMEREEATLAVSQYLAAQGVNYLRVHDVARHREVLS